MKREKRIKDDILRENYRGPNKGDLVAKQRYGPL